MKKCSRCGETKMEYAFYKDQANKDQLSNTCIECQREMYLANKIAEEKMLERVGRGLGSGPIQIVDLNKVPGMEIGKHFRVIDKLEEKVFEGRVMHMGSRFFILINERGIRESFLYVDNLLAHFLLEEVV